jgi:hypothetical protein
MQLALLDLAEMSDELRGRSLFFASQLLHADEQLIIGAMRER